MPVGVRRLLLARHEGTVTDCEGFYGSDLECDERHRGMKALVHRS